MKTFLILSILAALCQGAATVRGQNGVVIGTNGFGPVFAPRAGAVTNAYQPKWIHVTWRQPAPAEVGSNEVLTVVWHSDDLSSTNWQFVEGIPQGLPGDLYFPNAPGCCFFKVSLYEFVPVRRYQAAAVAKAGSLLRSQPLIVQ